jgi:hypothetical protein
MTDQHFEVDVLIRDAEGNQSEAHGEYKTADSRHWHGGQRGHRGAQESAGAKYRPINPDA